nr:MAG TPA: hypothetical protein [Crassvirales sp.]
MPFVYNILISIIIIFFFKIFYFLNSSNFRSIFPFFRKIYRLSY